jgi:hypothetical protein
MVRWLPIELMVVGLLLAAGAAGLMAFRPLRLRSLRPVRVVSRAGPPPSVVVHDSGRRPAVVVRIEPHASAVVTTIEDTRP